MYKRTQDKTRCNRGFSDNLCVFFSHLAIGTTLKITILCVVQ